MALICPLTWALDETGFHGWVVNIFEDFVSSIGPLRDLFPATPARSTRITFNTSYGTRQTLGPTRKVPQRTNAVTHTCLNPALFEFLKRNVLSFIVLLGNVGGHAQNTRSLSVFYPTLKHSQLQSGRCCFERNLLALPSDMREHASSKNLLLAATRSKPPRLTPRSSARPVTPFSFGHKRHEGSSSLSPPAHSNSFLVTGTLLPSAKTPSPA